MHVPHGLLTGVKGISPRLHGSDVVDSLRYRDLSEVSKLRWRHAETNPNTQDRALRDLSCRIVGNGGNHAGCVGVLIVKLGCFTYC